VVTPAYASIRECRESDLARFGELGSPRHIQHCRSDFERMQRGEALILVAVDEQDAPMGKLHVDFVRRAAEQAATIGAAAVAPSLQGRGIGTALMDAAETVIRERGLVFAELGVEDLNPRARRLYERLGYRPIGEETFSYEVGSPESPPTLISSPGTRLRKRLAPDRQAPTAERVWAALDEIPDPEIPVISLVDLGVVRDVAVDGERVRVEFTPTFLGCPALEVMRDAMAARIRDLGGEPEIEVVLDDSWSTDKITPAGRAKLRESGFAPPAPRAAAPPQLVQLQSKAFRCPYCGSTDTKLENIFGPTPCRSLRYCASCRQPFEQFKTI
jgi:ring-1,2-phenylacetyl-CoA epoxidase subunit PaaD